MLSSDLLYWLSESVICAYIEDCLDRGLSDKTVEWYAWHLRRARDWLADEPSYTPLDLFSRDGVSAYFRSTRNTMANNSRVYMVNCLRTFGKWLAEFGMTSPTAHLKRPRLEKSLPDVLAPAEVQRLIRHMAGPDAPVRERAVVYLLLDTGLRVSELAALRRFDIDLTDCKVIVRNGKGSKGRVAFFSVETATALADYLVTHDEPSVFVSERRGRGLTPLTDNGIRQMLRRLAKSIGLERLSPHMLRRTCGTEYHAAGVDLDLIGDQFGHEHVSTTRIYARLADTRRRDLLMEASPVSRALAASAVAVPDWPTGQGVHRHRR
jgi:site-specific recombinase XerD